MKATSKGVINKKKKLQTTLGKAPEPPREGNEEEIDVSHVGRSIETSIHGLHQVVSLLKNATAEVKHYITYECDVMYECRICRTIFRSLANFILHKRRYCRKNYNPAEETDKCRDSCQNNNANHVSTKNNRDDNINHSSSIVAEPPAETSQKVVRGTKKNISTVLEKLMQKQEQRKDVEEIASTDLSKETEKDYEKVDESNTVALEKIDSNSSGMFQTMFKDMIHEHGKMDFMKTEVMELHGIFSSDEAVLGPDGKIHPFDLESTPSKQFTPKHSLVCTICSQKFSTRKTLTYHVKYKHNSTRMVYQCPVCKDQFANAWCVFRHLYKVHRKTSAQIRKMRDDIHASAFRKDQETATVVKKDVAEEPRSGCSDTENQWMNNMESDIDLQMCGGCGKRFERKAALHSHSKMCAQRINICNTIKEKNMKQALEEARNQKLTKANSCQPKGSERRKPILLRRKCAKSREKTEDLESEKKGEAEKESNLENEKESETEKDIKIEVESVENETENRLENGESEKQENDAESDNEIKAESLNDEKLELEELSVNDSHTLSGEEVTLDLSMDFEPEYDLLLMGNEHLSMFRSSMSRADICDIIGVPSMKIEPEEINTKPVADIEEEQTCAVNDNNNSNNSIVELFQDDDSCGLSACLDADIETTIKEISLLHHQLSTSEESANKPPKRKRTCPTEKRSSDTTDLECKAEKFMDVRKCLCVPCDEKFGSYCDLVEHMSQHFNWYCYQCCECNYMCYYEETCLQHVAKEHKGEQDVVKNAVLPVPNWKALKLSTDFLPLKVDLKTCVSQCPVIKTAREQPPRLNRQRRKSVKVIQNEFLYDLDRIPKNLRKKTKGVKSTKKVEATSKKSSGGASKLLVIKPVKVYVKKEKSVRKGGAIVNSSKDLGGKD